MSPAGRPEQKRQPLWRTPLKVLKRYWLPCVRRGPHGRRLCRCQLLAGTPGRDAGGLPVRGDSWATPAFVLATPSSVRPAPARRRSV